MALMSSKLKWSTKLLFQGESRTHKVILDAKKESGGTDFGMTPKEMVLNGLCGCSGMDVISLLTSKFKLQVSHLEITAQATSTEGGHPVVWSKIELEFALTGDFPSDQAKRAVDLSLTRYCGVSAMLSKACPITYTIIHNGALIGTGTSKFE